MKKEQAATEAALNQFSRNLLLWALISLAMVVLFNLFNQPIPRSSLLPTVIFSLR